MEILNRNRICRFVALLLALLMLCGCGEPTSQPTEASTQPPTAPSEPSDPTEPTQPSVPTEPTDPSDPTDPTDPIEPTDPTDPTDPIDPTDPTDPSDPTDPIPPDEPEMPPVTELECVEFDVPPEVLSLGNGLIVVSRNTYRSGQGRVNETQIIDIFNDSVVASALRTGSVELVPQRFADGFIVMGEPSTGKFLVFDQTLSEIASFATPNLDGFFSHDRSQYYYVQEGTLYGMNLSDESCLEISLDQPLRFQSLLGLHPSENRLVARVYLSNEGHAYGLAVLEIETGKVLLLRDDLTMAWLTGDRFYGLQMNPTQMGYDLYYGSLVEGIIQCIPRDQLYSSSVHYEVLPGCDYLVWWLKPDSGERETKVYDLANGGVAADLADYGFTTAACSPVYLSQEQLILGYYAVKSDSGKETFRLVIINPSALTYEEGVTPEEAPWQTRVDAFRVE